MQSQLARPKRPRWTVKGVVVYKQPKHIWTAEAIARISARTIKQSPGIVDVLLTICDKINRAMMESIFATFGLQIFAQTVYEFLLRIVDWALSGVIAYLPKDYSEQIADGVFYAVSSYSPAVQALITAANAPRPV